HHHGTVRPRRARRHGLVHRRAQPARLPAAGDLSPARTFLAVPVDRDRHLRPAHPGPDVVLLPLGAQARVMTRVTAALLALLLAAACCAQEAPRGQARTSSAGTVCAPPSGEPKA